MKLNIDKLKENTIPYEELSEKHFLDIEFQKEYLNLSLAEYITDGDFNKFFKYYYIDSDPFYIYNNNNNGIIFYMYR